jgi:L-lactate dehydrogenase complex protein LldE
MLKEVRARTYELVEFLHDIQKPDAFSWAKFPHRVGLHNSCGTLSARPSASSPTDRASR